MCVCIFGGDICFATEVNVDGSSGVETIGSGNLGTTVEYARGNEFKQYADGALIPTKSSSYNTPAISFKYDFDESFNYLVKTAIIKGDEVKRVTSSNPKDWAVDTGLNSIVLEVVNDDGTKSYKDIGDFATADDLSKFINESYWKNPKYAEEISQALTNTCSWKSEEVLDVIRNKIDFEKIKEASGSTWEAESIKSTVLTKITSGVGGSLSNLNNAKLEKAIFDAVKDVLPGFGEVNLENMPQLWGYDENSNKIPLSLIHI